MIGLSVMYDNVAVLMYVVSVDKFERYLSNIEGETPSVHVAVLYV